MKISTYKGKESTLLLASVGAYLSIVSMETFKWKQFPNTLNDAVE